MYLTYVFSVYEPRFRYNTQRIIQSGADLGDKIGQEIDPILTV